LHQHVSHAAQWSKADLCSDMVGEFPELQGIMGRYYAKLAGAPDEVTLAIAQHYQPRFSGDSLPQNKTGLLVALADKMECLVGMWSVGHAPTGEKDAYGLRRAALGIIRMLQTIPISLDTLLQQTLDTFTFTPEQRQTIAKDIFAFINDRLRHYLAQNYSIDTVDALLAKPCFYFNKLSENLDALSQFKTMPDAAELIAAQKRVRNVLKKSGKIHQSKVCETLFCESHEKDLYQASIQLGTPKLLGDLYQLHAPITQFFEHVMVMVEQQDIRDNRLALLAQVAQQFDVFADLTLLSINE
jgi:glycyl-tRNA synthetase beta chain